MNTSKTKIISNSNHTITNINNDVIEYVNEYIYLGQLISTEDTVQKEVQRRITNTWKRYWSLSEIMKNNEIPIKDKRRVYNTCILPCLTYGCQTWTLTQHLSNKIRTCQNAIERSVIGVKRRDRVRLENIKNKKKFKSVEKTYRTLKWKWTGHMIRENKEKWTKIITEWYPRGSKRSKGRQAKRWEDEIKKVTGPIWTRTGKNGKP